MPQDHNMCTISITKNSILTYDTSFNHILAHKTPLIVTYFPSAVLILIPSAPTTSNFIAGCNAFILQKS